jgi:putative ABC transport system permease protein
MIFKNLRLALRNLIHYKGVNGINIAGLSIGILAFLLIYQYLKFEKSYDRYFDNADQIQRLVFYRYYQTGLDKSVGNNYYIGQLAYEKIPSIVNFCRCKRETAFIRAGDDIYKEERTLYADSSFFDIFSYKVISGDKKNFLRGPDEVILTRSAAKKYFGDADAIGQTIFSVNPGKRPLTVTGIVENVKPNSHLKFDIVISLSTITDQNYCYNCNNTNTYFLLRKGADKKVIEDDIKAIVLENRKSRNLDPGFPIEFYLQPIEDIHLHSNYRFEYEPNGNNKYVSVLLMVAMLILASAGMNYFNLYSSVVNRRITGMGIKIINGASRSKIMNEFITEAMLTGIISLIVAMILLDMLFPLFREYLNLDFSIDHVLNLKIWLVPALSLIILSIISGLILGIRIYGVAPASFIRKDLSLAGKKLSQKFLSIGQFIIAIFLITCTIGALKQIRFMQDETLTMKMDQIMVVKRPVSREFNDAQNSFQESLQKFPEIKEITYSTIMPGQKNTWVKGGISIKGNEKLDYQIFQADVAPGFFSFFNVKLLAGRHFYPDETNWKEGPHHLILNKEAAIAFGVKDLKELIGKRLYDTDNKGDIGEVVGIVDGYFQNSPDQQINPTIYNCDHAGYYIFIKISKINMVSEVGKIKNVFNKFFKDQYFEYYFLDDFFNAQYKSYVQLFRCFILFSIMAIVITTLSLLGLVIQVAAARTKEIGIRKLNGAKVREILVLLNKDYVILVSVALVIAIPLAWIALRQWLEAFASRTELNWWIFAGSSIIAYGIAIGTVSWQSWRAATRNPVEALRYE